MTDFDKLIKEKAEQAEYTYKPAAWRSFRQKSGFGRNALKYWVAGVSSAVVIGGLTTILLLRTSTPADRGGLSSTNEHSRNVVALDTISTCVEGDALLGNDTMLLTGNREQAAPQHKAAPTVVSKPTNENANDKIANSAGASKPKKNNIPRYGRPLVIDVDTIKENVPTDEELRNGHSRLY